jgi:hypothetical protein
VVWFRVDDAFWRGKSVRRLGADPGPAVGLWTLAGTWSSDNLTDGFVPSTVVATWDPSGFSVKRLKDADLWVDATVDGEEGVQFLNWAKWQPTKEDVEKKRAGQRERTRRFREKTGRFGSSEDQSGDAPGNALHNAVVTTAPTRPDPKGWGGAVVGDGSSSLDVVTFSPRGDEKMAADKKPQRGKRAGTRIPEDFAVTDAMVAWAREKTPNVDGRHETEQFIDYWTAATGKNAEKLDWVATWRRWMRKAEQDRAESVSKRRSTADEWDMLTNADE